MVQMTIEMPESALAALRKTPEDFARELRLAAAVKWYELRQYVSTQCAILNRARHEHPQPETRTRRVALDKHRSMPLGKTRTREHVIADLGLNHVERHVLLCGFTLQRIHSDYGYDYVMWTNNPQGEIESGITYFQIKATDQLPLLKDGKTVSWPVSRRDLRLWLNEANPVVLIVYDGTADRAYWLYVQAYFAQRSTTELFSAGETVNVHISVKNRVSRRSIGKIAGYKHEIERQLSGKVHHHV